MTSTSEIQSFWSNAHEWPRKKEGISVTVTKIYTEQTLLCVSEIDMYIVHYSTQHTTHFIHYVVKVIFLQLSELYMRKMCFQFSFPVKTK